MTVPILRLRGGDGQMHDVLAIQGPKGEKGDTGMTGPAYTLTGSDKAAIVQAVLAALPDGDGVSY